MESRTNYDRNKTFKQGQKLFWTNKEHRYVGEVYVSMVESDPISTYIGSLMIVEAFSGGSTVCLK